MTPFLSGRPFLCVWVSEEGGAPSSKYEMPAPGTEKSERKKIHHIVM